MPKDNRLSQSGTQLTAAALRAKLGGLTAGELSDTAATLRVTCRVCGAVRDVAVSTQETGGAKVRQWIGKTGTVQHQVGPEAWDVLFTAKVAKPVTGKAVAEYQSFHFSELEVEG